MKFDIAHDLTDSPYVNLVWGVLLYALWGEFMETETGRRFKLGKGIDVFDVAYDLGSYLRA